MSRSAHPSNARVAPSWVVTLSVGGVKKGMVGPFADAAAAEAWAVEAVAGRRGWSWRCEPVVSPAALPVGGRAERERPRPRPRPRHLVVVR